jgi:putative component of toxin-antitoxin plasmid stabilization module
MYPIGYTADASTDDRGQAESDLIVLLVGGDKSSQWTDIEKAKALADNL